MGISDFNPNSAEWGKINFDGELLTMTNAFNLPCGKESTKVKITQNKVKESESSYQK